VADVGQGSFDLTLCVGRVLDKTREIHACLVDLATSDRVPWGLGGKVGDQEERSGPHPLQDERQLPAHLALDTGDGSEYTGGEKNTSAPAHADVCGDVGAQNGGDDLAGVAG